MRKALYWIPAVTVAAIVLTGLGLWNRRLGAENQSLALALDAERQRNFSEMVYHVEQIQTLLGKGLAAGSPQHNMRYMGDVHHHADAAVANFNALPLPPELQASTGKFLQQTGDLALSLLRNEAAGREMTPTLRSDLARVRTNSRDLSASLLDIASRHSQDGFRWTQRLRFSWAALTGRLAGTEAKPNTQDQAPQSMTEGGWSTIGSSMEKLPSLLYDGPFSDHVGTRAPAVAGPQVTQAEAAARMRSLVPGGDRLSIVGAEEVGGTLTAYSFKLSPVTGSTDYTATADIARAGGYLIQLLNSRMTGKPTLDLAAATAIGQKYLTGIGFPNMMPTYGQAEDGAATVAYAYRDDGVILYPDQIKLKVALDNGEILGVDARQYLLFHHTRQLQRPKVSASEAEDALNPDLVVQRVQIALIPDQARTGEILTYEFLATLGNDTFLVYINADTGMEEEILQQVETDGGTFAL